MLREVHGRPKLQLSEVEDVGSMRGHHHRHLLPARLECEVECCGHAFAVIASEELVTLREKVVEEAPDAKKSTGSFESAEGSREVLLDPSSSEGKKVCIRTALSSE